MFSCETYTYLRLVIFLSVRNVSTSGRFFFGIISELTSYYGTRFRFRRNSRLFVNVFQIVIFLLSRIISIPIFH